MSFDLKLAQGDLQLGVTRDIAIVENGEKLTQDILKIISTDLGANKNYPFYGSPISRSLVGRAFDTNFVKTLATEQLRYSVSTLQRLQLEQLKKDQVVTAQEQIASIERVDISQNAVDPRFYNVLLVVMSKAFRRVQSSFGVTL